MRMINNYKLELFDKLNFLSDFAKKGLSSFPDELTLFVTNELDLKGAALLEENDKNKFSVIGKYGITNNVIVKGDSFSIKNYSEINNNKIFNNKFTSTCELEIFSSSLNLLNIAFGYNNNSVAILILNLKTKPSPENYEQFFPIASLISEYLSIWKNHGGKYNTANSFSFIKLVEESAKGFRKIANTINGLVSILTEGETDNSTYSSNIKQNTSQLLSSINDLIDISQIEQNRLNISEEKIELKEFIDNTTEIYKTNVSNIKIIKTNEINNNIYYDKALLTQILNNLLSTINYLSTNNEINIQTKNIATNKIGLSFSTITKDINQENKNNLFKPFILNQIINEPSNQLSGLTLQLTKRICNLTDIEFNISIDGKNKIVFTLIFNSSISDNKTQTNIKLPEATSEINTILIIESDHASSKLLNNHLSKWNYKTEFVNNGNVALDLLKKNKYVAVILNVDQENYNSLELLQKIKNNKTTRNTPVIVFSIEPEKEKVFLMGAVEYLVKPINYNNLVEILTSYKLRRNSNVLCVDDDKPTLKLVEQAIRTAGFNVISEYRSELVMDLISDKDIDLAIIDLDMPKLNGFELIKQIKSVERFSKLPIIIYTGKEDYQEDLEKIDGMFVELLDKKSTSFNELEKAISDMIKSYEEPKPVAEQEVNTTGPKILMAEDYKHSQIIVTRLLKKNGFENITVVENGAEALRICENEKIDLILMDMQMPVMNGFEATGEIRELEGYEDTPIIALTAFAMKGDREKCLEAGATDYIAKPIDSKEFIEKVKYYSQTKVNS